MGFIIEYGEQSVSHGVHTHQNYELLYVREGEVMLTIRGRDYPVRAGSMVFLNQFDEHATRMIADVYRRYYLLIPPTQLKAFHNDVLLLSVFRFHGENFPYVLDTGAAKPRFDTYFALLRDASERGRPGAIVNTTSTSGLLGNLGQSNYGAAKAGVAAFTVITALELARYGIRVNEVVSPADRLRSLEL